jgi:hypothetical protein
MSWSQALPTLPVYGFRAPFGSDLPLYVLVALSCLYALHPFQAYLRPLLDLGQRPVLDMHHLNTLLFRLGMSCRHMWSGGSVTLSFRGYILAWCCGVAMHLPFWVVLSINIIWNNILTILQIRYGSGTTYIILIWHNIIRYDTNITGDFP